VATTSTDNSLPLAYSKWIGHINQNFITDSKSIFKKKEKKKKQNIIILETRSVYKNSLVIQ